MSDSSFVTRLSWDPSDSRGSTFILHTTWKSHEVAFALLDLQSDTGFLGVLPHAQLEITAQQLEISFPEFLAETKTVLTQSVRAVESFQFELKNNILTWRKRLSDQLKIIYGYVSLTTTPSIHHDILHRSLDIQLSHRDALAKIATERDELRAENEELRCEMDKCLVEKTELEHTLLRKFAALLNAKKKRIVELEEELRVKVDEVTQLKQSTTDIPGDRRRVEAGNDATDDGSDTNHSSDESDTGYQQTVSPASDVKRLNSDSSQPSQDMLAVAASLPKRVRLAGPSRALPLECKVEPRETTVDNLRKRTQVVVLEDSPKPPSGSFECDTQVMLNDL